MTGDGAVGVMTNRSFHRTRRREEEARKKKNNNNEQHSLLIFTLFPTLGYLRKLGDAD